MSFIGIHSINFTVDDSINAVKAYRSTYDDSVYQANDTFTMTKTGPTTTVVNAALTPINLTFGPLSTFSDVSFTGLPAGLTGAKNGANTAHITGTPTATGTFTINVKAKAVDTSGDVDAYSYKTFTVPLTVTAS